MPIQINNMTLAATNVDTMVAFYNAVLETNFQGFEMFPGTTAYRGILAGIDVLLCPNTIAGVEAKQNRHQFEFVVDDVKTTFSTALAHGGTELTAVEEHHGVLIVSVYDPDGNSIVFIQKSS